MKKSYDAFVEFKGVSKSDFEDKLKKLKTILENNDILQQTPTRVLHRRADLTRKKKVFEVQGEYINSDLARFKITAIGGTYIKELISGDDNRTTPSFTEVFGSVCKCVELDVINVE